MRYLDEARLESPNHCPYFCSRPGCEKWTPRNECWTLTLRYRDLGNEWQVSEGIMYFCSRECAEILAREQFGADEVKCLDHDAEGEQIRREIEQARAEHQARQQQA